MHRQATRAGRATVVAVHGIQGTSAAWLPVAEACASKARFMTPNLRGRGDAYRGTGPDEYSLSAFADDLQEITRDQLSGTPFILAGWSMGVSVILEYLRQTDTPRPQGLILLSGTPALYCVPWFSRDSDRLLTEVVEREKRLALKQAADHQAVAWTWGSIRNTDHRSELKSIDIPTLILHGAADEDTPVDHAHWLGKGIPHAKLVVIDEAGHNLLTENTHSVSEQIVGFIDSIITRQEA